MRALPSLRACLIAVAVTAATALLPATAYPLDVDIGIFFDELSPHGNWYNSPRYGWVFSPRVANSWRPYTVGHWVWTDDYGWLWASDEDFGWATFHYGRWYYEPAFGWGWVPGYEWGPSWVSYRYGGNYVGWAPLPPRVGWSTNVGLQLGGGGIDAMIEPSYYTFVPARAFVNTGIQRYAVPVSQNRTIINVTRNITNYSVAQGRVINRSLRIDEVEKVVGRPVRRARPVEVDSVKVVRKARVKDDEIPVFKPRVREAKAKAPASWKPLPGTAAARPDQGKHEADERATVQRRADEAKRQAEINKKREADARAEQQRQAEARRQLERETQERQRKELEQRQAQQKEHQKEQARQQSEQQKAGVSREKSPTPQPSKKPATKKKEKPKKPDEEKPPNDNR